ncbi:hypothetical protein DFP72DRAFT_1128733 [Ephemerocybe angulata]|uniref:Uncharacterized protein n=1 Tax=Ephemerocybe angulata TaxID=980116 RepID=A0A8H6HW71_9AGAR|nr:hypothetical protein DFP72DRAFT_1128733 [Tulosesus angulatus]
MTYRTEGAGQASIMLNGILEVGVQSTDDPDSLEQIVDFALDVWLDVATSRWDDDVAMSPAAYEDQYLIPYQPITRCISHDPSRTILFQKVDALDHKSLKALVNFFHHQCNLWPTVYREQYQQDRDHLNCGLLAHYVTGIVFFCEESDAFFKIMSKSQNALDTLEAGAPVICDCLEHDFYAGQSQDALGSSIGRLSTGMMGFLKITLYCPDQAVHQFHISYRSRVFKLLHLQEMLNELGLTSPLSDQDWSDDEDGNHKKDIIIFRATSLPVESYHSSVERAQTYTHTGIRVFDDDRVRAMIERCERVENAFFAASISSLGRYGVVTYGMFLEHFMGTDSDERPLKKVALTTSSMRVFDAVEGGWMYFNL